MLRYTIIEIESRTIFVNDFVLRTMQTTAGFKKPLTM